MRISYIIVIVLFISACAGQNNFDQKTFAKQMIEEYEFIQQEEEENESTTSLFKGSNFANMVSIRILENKEAKNKDMETIVQEFQTELPENIVLVAEHKQYIEYSADLTFFQLNIFIFKDVDSIILVIGNLPEYDIAKNILTKKIK